MDITRFPSRRKFLGLAGTTAVGLAGGVLQLGCHKSSGSAEVVEAKIEPTLPAPFLDVTKDSDIAFTNKNGEEAMHLAILESLGGGVALFDYDGDGLLDIFLCGGGYYAGADNQEIKGHPCKLYKNLGNFKFKDVTKEAGLEGPWFYTHGVAVADYDRDGWPDLLVTGWHQLLLFHNEPVDPKDPAKGRKFVNVTKKAGLPEGLWTTSAAWADFDGDGFADFYVCQYADWSFAKHPKCQYDGKTYDVCPPKQFNALPHKVFHNNGNGTFTDVSREAGLRMPRKEEDYQELSWLKDLAVEEAKIPLEKAREEFAQATDPARIKELREDIASIERELKVGGRYIKELRAADLGSPDDKAKPDKGQEYGKGLGVLAVDVNGDGKPDLFVANDTVDKFLYINYSVPGKIRFKEVGFSSGTARDDRGAADGSMGVYAADFNRIGKPSLWVVNYENEMHGLYVNNCAKDRFLFNWGTQANGIAAIGQSFVGFGTVFLDVDNDGWEDIFISNGHAVRFPTGKAARAQKPILLHNLANPADPKRRKFKDLIRDHVEIPGAYFEDAHVGRGCAVGDLDNDGRADLVMCHLNEPATVLKNVVENDNHWLGIELIGRDHRPIVGAKLILDVDGTTQQTQFAMGGGSYLSANDPRKIFGLAKARNVAKLTVIWPAADGKELEQQVWDGKDLPIDHYWRLVQGEKKVSSSPGQVRESKKE